MRHVTCHAIGEYHAWDTGRGRYYFQVLGTETQVLEAADVPPVVLRFLTRQLEMMRCR